MRYTALSGVVVMFCLFFSCKNNAKDKGAMKLEEYRQIVEHCVKTPPDISALFPKSVAQVKAQADACVELAQQEINKLIRVKASERTFDNTVRALDAMRANFSKMSEAIQVLTMVSPDKEIRDASHAASITIHQAAVDLFVNADLYRAFQEYLAGNGHAEQLNDEERYFLDEAMKEFKREGLHLPDKQLQEVKTLKKEISKLSLDFDMNIAADKSVIKVGRNELQGVDEHFIKSLSQEGEFYILKCDYPTINEVMQNCKVAKTRKSLYLAFNNRAYPKNLELLHMIIAKRDELAKKLDFKSYAALSYDAEMSKTPERVEHFLVELAEKAGKKMREELALLKGDLPEGVELDEQGKMQPWDYAYLKTSYKKKHFDVDERKIAEYFPVKKALDGMLAIYQNFLGLRFKVIKADWVWHEDVQLIEIHDTETDELRGYLFLDLYPRDDKYSHACMIPWIQPQNKKNLATGVYEKVPSVTVVIANFPKPSAERPALLKHSDVETFFHEFGHAMHGVLGRTNLASCAGTSVKNDFVEMPSQMFEEWMYEKEMLNQVSEHYETKESLPEALIDKKIALKKFDSGYFVLGQCKYALLSLEYFQEGAQKDTDAISKAIHHKLMPEMCFEPLAHFQASFGHLTGYGARYYSYMWSKVFALDIFYEVKRHGLADQAIGKKLVQTVLSKGGSKDPNDLIRDFLGRDPNQDAFLHDLGL